MPSAFELNASVNLDATSVNASAKQIQQALGRITGQASEFQKSLDASTARVFAFGATTAVLNGVTQSFKKLISVTVEVEKRLVEINSIFQATEATFNRFRNSIFQVAKETGQSFNTVAEGAAELARQGLSAEETAKRLKAALVLTRISGLDAEKSVKALTAAINGFTSAGLSANQIVNKMVAVDTAFAVSTQDLAEAFSRAGSTAEDAGVSFDQLLGLVTAVEQKTARGGAVIGNAFKSIFTRLQRGNTIDQLKELGVEIDATQSGIQKLSALSSALERISDPTTVSAIKELAGGVFQINVVSAALKDLGAETSIFASASKTAAAATNEAFTKNAELNKTLSAQINTLVVGLTSMAEKIGKLTFGPLLQNLVGIATKLTDFLDKALDPEKGSVFIKGLFKTIGTFLGGPAVVIFTAAFVKIFGLVAKFAKDGLKSVFEIGSQAQKITTIESGLVGLLQRDVELRKIIQSTTASQATKEQAVIQAIQRENALLAQQAALMKSLATAAAARGVSGFGQGGFTGKGGKRFNAGFRAEEAEARMRGAPSNVKARYSSGTIGGRKFIMNSHETEIPRFGRNGDSAVIPHYSGGFIPNYANFFSKKDSKGNFIDKKGIRANAVPKGEEGQYFNVNTGDVMKRGVKRVTKPQTEQVALVDPARTAMLIPNIGVSTRIPKGTTGRAKMGGKRMGFEYKSGLGVYGPKVPHAVDQAADPQDEMLRKSVRRSISRIAANYANLLEPVLGTPKPSDIIKQLEAQGGGKGALHGIVGAAFEAAVNVALDISPARASEGGDFDVKDMAEKANQDVITLFGVASKKTDLFDYKENAEAGSQASFAKKLYNEGRFKMVTREKKRGGRAAGYIPNYNARRGYGVPASQVKVHLDKNKTPFAVTNGRDEPPNSLAENAALQDAIGRERRGIGMFSGGFIPNYISEAEALRADRGGRRRIIKGGIGQRIGQFFSMLNTGSRGGNIRGKRHYSGQESLNSGTMADGANNLSGKLIKASESTDKFTKQLKKSADSVKKSAKKEEEASEDLSDQVSELAGEAAEGNGRMAAFSTAMIGASMAISMWSEAVQSANLETQALADKEIEAIKAAEKGIIVENHLIKLIQERADAEIEARSGILKFSDAVSKGVTVLMSLAAFKMLIPASLAAKGGGMLAAGAAGVAGAAARTRGLVSTGGRAGRALTSRGAGMLGRVGGAVGAFGFGALDWMSLNKQFEQGSIRRHERDVGRGGIMGGVGGALAGAAVGTAFLPIVGTIIGGMLGYMGGTKVGKFAAEMMGFGESELEATQRKSTVFSDVAFNEMIAKNFGKDISKTLGDVLSDSTLSEDLKQQMLNAAEKADNERRGDTDSMVGSFDAGGFVPKRLKDIRINPAGEFGGPTGMIAAALTGLQDEINTYISNLDPKVAKDVTDTLAAAQKSYSENVKAINESTEEEMTLTMRKEKVRLELKKLRDAYRAARGQVDMTDEEFARFTEQMKLVTAEVAKLREKTQKVISAFEAAANEATNDARVRSKITPTGPFAQQIGMQNKIDAARASVTARFREQIAARQGLENIFIGRGGLPAQGAELERIQKTMASEIKTATETLNKANAALALQMEDSMAELVNTENALIEAIKANTEALPKRQLSALGQMAKDSKAFRKADFGKVETLADKVANAQTQIQAFEFQKERGDFTRMGMTDDQISAKRLKMGVGLESLVTQLNSLIKRESGGSAAVQRGLERTAFDKIIKTSGDPDVMSKIAGLMQGTALEGLGEKGEAGRKAKETAITTELGKQVTEITNTTKALKGFKGMLESLVAQFGRSFTEEEARKKIFEETGRPMPENYASMTKAQRGEMGLPDLRIRGAEGVPTLVDISEAMGGDVKKAAEGIMSARENLNNINTQLEAGSLSMASMMHYGSAFWYMKCR